ncbi:UNVERIFIED_ORG: hypothetical protein M2328_002761 [Rhodococcus erythropolis]
MSKHTVHTVGTVKRDLEYLAESWPHIVNSKIPGTARSWVEKPQRRGVLSEADVDRLGKKGVPRPLPVEVGVLDLLATIADRADDIARCLLEVLGLATAALSNQQVQGVPWAWFDAADQDVALRWIEGCYLPTESATRDPRPWLRTASMRLMSADEMDELTVPWVAHQIAPLVSTTARLLGDVRDGQVMNGICPWCDGRTRDSLSGERTLQIHYPDPDDETDVPLVVCFGLNCNPPADSCGHRHDDRPAWPRREWDWLATVLRATDEGVRHAAS